MVGFLAGCQGNIKFSTDGGQIKTLFKMEIHTELQMSCQRCHEPQSTDPQAKLIPFAQNSEISSYEVLLSDPSRLQRMIERLDGREHPDPSDLKGIIRDRPEAFIAHLRELQKRLCLRDSKFCPKASILDYTDLKTLENVTPGQTKHLRFDLVRLGFPEAIAEIGYTQLNGFIQISQLRIHSPQDDLEIEGATAIFVDEQRKVESSLLAALPKVQVQKATQAPSPSAPMVGLSNLLTTTASSSMLVTDYPDLKIKFGAIRFKARSARDRFFLAVKPIVSTNCLSCHGGGNPSATAAMRLGLSSSSLLSDNDLYNTLKSRIIPGDVAGSLVIRKAANGESGHSLILVGPRLQSFRDWILIETN